MVYPRVSANNARGCIFHSRLMTAEEWSAPSDFGWFFGCTSRSCGEGLPRRERVGGPFSCPRGPASRQVCPPMRCCAARGADSAAGACIRGHSWRSNPAEALNNDAPGLSRRHLRSARILVVGVTGFEPATSSSRTTRATKLRHTPNPSLRAGLKSNFSRIADGRPIRETGAAVRRVSPATPGAGRRNGHRRRSAPPASRPRPRARHGSPGRGQRSPRWTTGAQ